MKCPKITKQKGIYCQKDYLTEILYLEKEVYLGRTILEVANAWDHCDCERCGKSQQKSMKLVT